MLLESKPRNSIGKGGKGRWAKEDNEILFILKIILNSNYFKFNQVQHHDIKGFLINL